MASAAPAAAPLSTSVLSEAETLKVFNKLKSQQSNKKCFDCGAKNPNWTSIPFGVYLCLDCSSIHRRMSTDISFVKSSSLDKWRKDQIVYMVAGGNQKAADFFAQRGWQDSGAAQRKEKYTSRAAVLYKQQLRKDLKQAEFALEEILHDNDAPAPEVLEGLDELESAVIAHIAQKHHTTPSALMNALTNASDAKGAKPASAKPASNGSASAAAAAAAASASASAAAADSASYLDEAAAAEASPVLEPAAAPAEPVVASPAPAPAPALDDPDGFFAELQDNPPTASAPKDSPRRVVIRKGATSSASKAVKPAAKSSTASLLTTSKPSSHSSAPTKVKLSTSRSSASSSQDELDNVMANLSVSSTPAPSTASAAPAPVIPKATKLSSASNDDDEPSSTGSGAAASKKFTKSKAISSDQYFGRNEFSAPSDEQKARLQQFSNARAISSDAFFDREEEPEEVDVNSIGQAVAAKGKQLQDAVSGFFSSLKSRYG